MRTIKFRGRRIDNGEWVCGDLSHRDWFSGTKANNLISIHIYPYEDVITPNPECYNIDPATVGQFTGLVDKNGKEIYEGDVVNVPNFIQLWDEQSDDLTGKIKYLDGAFHIDSEEPHFGEVPLLGIYTNEETTSEIEVIGNIHENPELLK